MSLAVALQKYKAVGMAFTVLCEFHCAILPDVLIISCLIF